MIDVGNGNSGQRDQDDPRRGSGSNDRIGAHPDPGPAPAGDPAWQPNRNVLGAWQKFFNHLLGDRKYLRNDSFWPYLIIRAAPGDHGVRPLWPPTSSWESPDILLMPADSVGPFDRSQLVAQPMAGKRYRVFVHIWNLGRFPAIGVRVQAWWAKPGFFNPDPNISALYTPTLIGGTFANLGDRTQPDCHQIVEIGTPWTVEPDQEGHECLLAVADCFGDPWNGRLDANHDRHVGQRNLTILSAQADLTPVLAQLRKALPKGAELQIIHAAAGAKAVLGALFSAELAAEPPSVTLPTAGNVSGVPVAGAGNHLGTFITTGDMDSFIPTDRLDIPPAGFAATAAAGPTVISVLRQAAPAELASMAIPVDADPADSLAQALRENFQTSNLDAATVAQALGGMATDAHLLRLIATAAGQFIGGYSILISPTAIQTTPAERPANQSRQ
jgi:hypothetical protein